MLLELEMAEVFAEEEAKPTRPGGGDAPRR
jgi:hypothetical protein